MRLSPQNNGVIKMAIYDNFLTLFLGTPSTAEGTMIYMVFGSIISIVLIAFIFRLLAFLGQKMIGR